MTPEIEKRIKAVKAGRVPTGYKKTKVGIVPKEWNVVSFGSISFKTGRKKKKDEYFPVYSINNQKGFCPQSEQFENDGYANTSKDSYTLVEKNTFAYNPARINIGSIGLLKEPEKVIISSLYVCFGLNNQCDLKFFEAYFKSYRFNYDVSNYNEGSVRQYLFYDNFAKINVAVPSLSEQKKIAEILSIQDKVIELKEKLIAEKLKQKHYLTNILFSGKKRLLGKSNKFVNTPIGEMPIDWKPTLFSSLFDVKSEHTEDLQKYPLYSLTLENGVTPKTERYERSHLVLKENVYKILYPNHFAYNPMNIRFGAIGLHRRNFSVAVSGYYDTFTCKDPSILIFMENFLKSKMMLRYYDKVSTGSLIEKKRVHLSQFLEFNLPLPSKDEIRAISSVLSSADEEISLLQRELEQEKLKKKSLMQLLLTGLVRV